MQQVHDVAGLFKVFHVGKYFLLLLVGHTTDKVGCIIRVHVVNETFRDYLGRERINEALPFVFLDLGEYVSSFLFI